MADRIVTALSIIANETLEEVEYDLARIRETSEIANSTRLAKGRLTGAITNVVKAIEALNEVIEEYKRNTIGG